MCHHIVPKFFLFGGSDTSGDGHPLAVFCSAQYCSVSAKCSESGRSLELTHTSHTEEHRLFISCIPEGNEVNIQKNAQWADEMA